MVTSPVILMRYHDARHELCDGDLLLWRRRGLISIAGRGVHSHAAKVAWWLPRSQRAAGGAARLMCLEVRELKGGRAVTLSSQVRRFPGRIDVFETNPDQWWPNYDRAAATRHMIGLAGCEYGYWNLWRAACLHLPLVRLAVPADCDAGERDYHPPFCSQACAEADQAGGATPVMNLPPRLTEPSDLARSPFYRYRYTLLP